MESPKYDDTLNLWLKTNADKLKEAQEAVSDHPPLDDPADDFGAAFGAWINNPKQKELGRYSTIVKSRDEILSVVKEARTKLENPENLKVIQKVIKARDRIYAHKDPNPNVEYVSSKEIKQLVSLANELSNLFNDKFFFTQIGFDFVRDWEIEYVLKRMVQLKKFVLKDLERLKNNPQDSD